MRLDDHVVRFVDSLDRRGGLRGGERVFRTRWRLLVVRQQVATGSFPDSLMRLGTRWRLRWRSRLRCGRLRRGRSPTTGLAPLRRLFDGELRQGRADFVCPIFARLPRLAAAGPLVDHGLFLRGRNAPPAQRLQALRGQQRKIRQVRGGLSG